MASRAAMSRLALPLWRRAHVLVTNRDGLLMVSGISSRALASPMVSWRVIWTNRMAAAQRSTRGWMSLATDAT
jgi:hypothetical protein